MDKNEHCGGENDFGIREYTVEHVFAGESSEGLFGRNHSLPLEGKVAEH